MAVQAVLAPSASFSRSHSSGSNSGARWLTTCRLQTLHTRARSLIRPNRSAGLLSALPSTLRKPPCSPCKAEGHRERSKVLLLHVMEQLLIFRPNPPLNTYLHSTKGNYTPLCCHLNMFKSDPATVGGSNIRRAEYGCLSVQGRGEELAASSRSHNERQMEVIPIGYTACLPLTILKYITHWNRVCCFKTTPVGLPHSGPSIPV